MQVDVDWDITSPNPERGVCRAARNDYYQGYVGEETFETVMEAVKGDTLDEKKYRLLTKTLLKKEHYGPFEHPQLAIQIKGVSRSLMAQITRHRHMSFDIQSMRYVNMEDADVVTPKSLTDPDHFSREGQTELDADQEELERLYNKTVADSFAAYNQLVELGVPKEDARMALPIGTKVNIYMSGNLRSFMHVLNMRAKANAQWEIRNLTEKVTDELDDWAPITAGYFEEEGPFRLGM